MTTVMWNRRNGRMHGGPMESRTAPTIGLRTAVKIRIVWICRASRDAIDHRRGLRMSMIVVVRMMVMMLLVRLLLVAGAAFAADLITITIATAVVPTGDITAIHQSVVPDQSLRETKSRPVSQELELVDIAEQSSLAVHVGIAGTAGGLVVNTGPVEDVVAQEVVLHNHGDGGLGLEELGVDRELLGYGDLIEAQSPQSNVALAGDVVDRAPEALANLLNEFQAADRSLRLQNQFALCRSIRSEHNLELQMYTLLYGRDICAYLDARYVRMILSITRPSVSPS